MANKFRRNSRDFNYWLRTAGVIVFSIILIGCMSASQFGTQNVSAAQVTGVLQSSTATAPTPRNSLAPLIEKLAPSVVNIRVTKIEKTGFGGSPFQGEPFGEFFKRFFGEDFRVPHNIPVQGAGSGVIITSDGYILTNNHVVEGAKEVVVTLTDKKEYKGRIVGRDPKTDLAILKIDADKDLPKAKLGDSDRLKVGDQVIAIGNPFGLGHTVTSGIVSAKGRVIGAGPYDDFIQTDASINPGNSGGPLFNMQGEVVGINTAIIPQGQGIGFAIPVNTAKPLIPQLVKEGKVRRGYLGVNIQSITPDLAKALNLGKTNGALVADVISGSPAAEAGIKRGDIIIAFNGKPVADSHELPAMVAAAPVGKKATVKVLRNGKEKKFKVKIGELPSNEAKADAFSKPAQGKWGLLLRDLTPQLADQLGIESDHGVLVVGVEDGSPADRASIQEGDVIVEVNRKPVKSVSDVKERIAESRNRDSLLLLVQRKEGKMFVVLTS